MYLSNKEVKYMVKTRPYNAPAGVQHKLDDDDDDDDDGDDMVKTCATFNFFNFYFI